MRVTFRGIEPIRPGFARDLHLVIPADFWADEALDLGELRAQFRDWNDGTLLADLSTEAGTIEREAPTTLVFKLSTQATTAMDGASIAVTDIVRTAAAISTPIPGRYVWPVKRTVTRND